MVKYGTQKPIKIPLSLLLKLESKKPVKAAKKIDHTKLLEKVNTINNRTKRKRAK